MPLSILDSPQQQTIVQSIQNSGIDVYPIATLEQALHVCFSTLRESV